MRGVLGRLVAALLGILGGQNRGFNNRRSRSSISSNWVLFFLVLNYDCSVVEHANKFLDAMGAHVGDRDLCLHEFSKSLSDKAYTCEKRITILDLHNTRQCIGEDLMAYVKRFRDLTLDCYGGHAESFLVEICINNMFSEYRIVLENIKINQFARLLDVARRTAISVKAISTGKSAVKSTEKKTTAHTLAVSIGGECLNAEAHAIRAYLEFSNAITFTDEDMEAPYPDHKKPFYLSAQINSVSVKCALVDTGSALNLIPLSTITIVRVPQRRIVRSPLSIVGFSNNSEDALGYIQLELKGRLHGKVFCISTNPLPFDQIETHFAKAAFSDEFALSGEATMSHPSGTILLAWNDIKDNPDLDLRSILEHKRQKKEQSRMPHLTLEARNKILIEHLDSSGEVDHLIPPDELPTLHKAQLVFTSLESLEAVDLGDDSANPRQKYKDVFTWNYDEMLGLDLALVVHSLNVDPNMKPIVQPNCAFHLEVTLKIKEENEWIKCCVDFRDHNKACPKDEFSIPDMDVLMDNMAGCEMHSFMDGSSWYNQISMCPSDAEKTAFCTPIGNFYHVVMPFGFKNAGSTYQRVMVAIFHDFNHVYIEIYINDFVVKSKTRLGHFDVLRKVVEKCRLYKLKMNPVKCAFDVSVGKFMGFLMSKHGILSAFSPLLKKGSAFTWTVEQQRAFSHLQDLMLRLPTISVPIRGKPLKVYLSTIDKVVSALVAQDDQEGKEQPVYYVSRNLKGVEYNLSLSLSPFINPTTIKGQAVVDLLSEFFGEVQYPIFDEVPSGEIAIAQEIEEEWTLCFDGFSTAKKAGAGVVLRDEKHHDVVFSFKLDFQCTNNTTEYEAYLIGLALAKEAGVQHLKVIGDFGLILGQVQGAFAVQEEHLAPDHTFSQYLEQSFASIRYGGILARCVSDKEAYRKRREIHDRTCGHDNHISLYRHIQRAGYYWPDIARQSTKFQQQCISCQ
ncbi:hypothetical protein SLEP1_g44433 [Rubroshorea leprosula]|uniref:Reverse transcriptase n=1 Tax=Rubroshorea leprosula TaxID=152421 RepID=A0AAV5LGL5_9ROSI|nr:hypothetical protein SLEP1_g44433 [Rubroshorea leprosula]